MRLPIYSLHFNSNARRLLSLNTILYVVLWVVCECIRDDRPSEVPGHLLAVEGLKLVFSFVMYSWQRGSARAEFYRDLAQDEGQGSEDLSERSPSFVAGTTQSTLYCASIALLYSARSYFAAAAVRIVDPLTLYFVIPIATLCTLSLLQSSFSRTFTLLQWQAVLLQFFGLFMVQSTVVLEPPLHSTSSVVLGVALFTSLPVVLSDHIYKAHKATPSLFNYLNIILFASGFSLNILFSTVLHFLGNTDYSSHLTLSSLVLPFVEATRDIAALSIIFNYDAAVSGVLTSFSCSILLSALAIASMLFSVGVLSGCILVLVGSTTFALSMHHRETVGESEAIPKHETRYRKVCFIAFTTVLMFVAFTLPRDAHESRQVVRSVSNTFHLASAHPNCRRKPTSSSLYASPTRTYHEFDNVLLIVFFSHARYDANLDYYKEVYSDYFPNMIFIGTGSREDAGFSHSYDVIVDTYKSDEDLNDPSFYKIGGRMGHHMLYTALKDYDCGYDGYLWAPFDTFLNVPRLQQFDQDYFWYHSPWGAFVPNPALGSSNENANKSRHPPPANVSPDPAINQTETWRGWGPDWWWGEPHVGLEVCMKGYYNIPASMRKRLSVFTDGMTRLIGGSMDTVYIPGRHATKFKQVLGLFLETDCFSEIAVPSTLHSVVPLHEPILFVDHWWIWQPPFNATFVRQKWDEGYEVDTFHTFHWGDSGLDGKWRGNHENVDDIRQLLAESAKRQGLEFWAIP